MRRENFYPIMLIAVVSIAAFFRLYGLKNLPPGLYPDEAMNGNNAAEALSTHHWKIFYPENNGREGLFINIQSFFLAIFQKHEPWILRLPSALFGIFTVLGLYFLGKELLDKRTGLLSAFLLATSFWHINFSRIGFRAIAAPFFLVWGLYFFIGSFREKTASAKMIWPVAAGIAYGLGFYTYIAYRVTPLLLIPIAWYFRKSPDFKKIIATFLVWTFITALPIGLYFLKNPQDFLGRTAQISVLSAQSPIKTLGMNAIKTFGEFNFAGDANWRHNYNGQPELFWPVGLIFIAGLIRAIAGLFKKYKGDSRDVAAYGILLSALAVTSLPVIISNEGMPHALRSILMAPPVFILSAIGGVLLFDYFRTRVNPIYLGFTAALALSLLTLEPYSTYFIKWGNNKITAASFNKNYADAARLINTLPQSLPKYVVVEAPGVPVRGIPMPAQTIMFLTDTFSPANQKIKNMHYILPSQIQTVPLKSFIFYVI